MTSDEIFEIRDLNYLYRLWNDKTISEPERIDIASMIDRIEKHNAELESAKFNENERPIIKNNDYLDIIER